MSPADFLDPSGNDTRAIRVTIETAYVTSLFGLHLRHRDNHLLDGRSTQFPKMVFQP